MRRPLVSFGGGLSRMPPVQWRRPPVELVWCLLLLAMNPPYVCRGQIAKELNLDRSIPEDLQVLESVLSKLPSEDPDAWDKTDPVQAGYAENKLRKYKFVNTDLLTRGKVVDVVKEDMSSEATGKAQGPQGSDDNPAIITAGAEFVFFQKQSTSVLKSGLKKIVEHTQTFKAHPRKPPNNNH